MVAVGLVGVATGSALCGTLDARPVLLIGSGVLTVVGLWTTVRIGSLVVVPRRACDAACPRCAQLGHIWALGSSVRRSPAS